MEYIKLGTVAQQVTDGETTSAAVVAAVTADTLRVVNVKGLVLTAAQVASHLSGAVDGDTLTWTSANVWPG